MSLQVVDSFGFEQGSEAVDYIGDQVSAAGLEMPKASLTLGSGLKSYADRYTHPDSRVVIPQGNIPNFPRPCKQAAGHDGKLIIAPVEEGSSETVAVWAGRVHFYQRLLQRIEQQWVSITDPEVRKAAVGFYIAINKLMGVQDMFTSNAAGSSDPSHQVGDIIRISDHLMDPADDFGVPEDSRWFDAKAAADPEYNYSEEDFFYSQAQLYSDEIHKLADSVASDLGWSLKEAILNWRKGRGYETVAYVKARTRMGASLFGMSTAPEAQRARSVGFSNKPGEAHFAGFTLVSNVAQLDPAQELNHGEVTEASAGNEGRFNPFMHELIRRRIAQCAEAVTSSS